jgi:hypothetical protein
VEKEEAAFKTSPKSQPHQPSWNNNSASVGRTQVSYIFANSLHSQAEREVKCLWQLVGSMTFTA